MFQSSLPCFLRPSSSLSLSEVWLSEGFIYWFLNVLCCYSKTSLLSGISIQQSLVKLREVIWFWKFERIIIEEVLMPLDFSEHSLLVKYKGFCTYPWQFSTLSRSKAEYGNHWCFTIWEFIMAELFQTKVTSCGGVTKQKKFWVSAALSSCNCVLCFSTIRPFLLTL